MAGKSKTTIKIIAGLIVLAAVGFVSFRAGVFVTEEAAMKTPPAKIVGAELDKPDGVNFSIFWETWRRLEKNFIDQDKISYPKMVYGATEGMVKSLGDPYTSFFTPQETINFNDELAGKYEGVGMYVGIKDEQLTVIAPLKGTPAEQAGIKAGDKILKIENTYTKDIATEEAVRLIKGPSGTEVKLLILRQDWVEPKEFLVKRQVIKIPTVEWEMVGQNKNIALIKIYQFNQILPSEFNKTASEIIGSPAKKIIIDLRNNPGGYLEVAQEIAGWFLKKGEVVVWQDTGEKEERKPYYSNGPSVFLKYPMAVLINEGSASASEILAGALRDNRGVKLVGEKSFGKGSVQEQISLSDRSSLKVTVARWLTPNGFSIDKEGLKADIEVKMSSEEPGTGEEAKDVQLEKAIEFVSSLE